MGHGPLDFCQVKANFSARVPKNLGGPRPPQEVVSARLKRRACAQTGAIFVPRVFSLIIDHAGEGSGVENKLLYREPKSCIYGAPFVNLLFISLLVVFFVICSFIYDNFITDCPFSQRSNFTIIGYLIKPFLYLLVI